jgi:hypothetical protein
LDYDDLRGASIDIPTDHPWSDARRIQDEFERNNPAIVKP